MRHALPLLLLLTGCTPIRVATWEQIHEATAITCFETAHGILVRTEGGADCPDYEETARDTARVLTEYRLDALAFVGVTVTLTNSDLRCDGAIAYGCTDLAVRHAVVSIWAPFPRATTRHELAHLAIAEQGGGPAAHAHLDRRDRREQRRLIDTSWTRAH